jgi:type VI secretion system protein ImpJ
VQLSKHLSKVLWSEGMSLGPHHFQTQNRYFEDSVQFSVNSLWFASYGLTRCELGHAALQNGTLSLVHASGLFGDGLPFDIPSVDAPPEPRSITRLIPPTTDSVIALLGIPRFKPGGANVADPDSEASDSCRYIVDKKMLFDDNTGRDEKPIGLGRKNIRLILETEATEDMELLPVGRILRDEAGLFVFDPKFIPPCLKIDASPRLMELVNRLVEVLEEKNKTLSQEKSGVAPSELVRFWLLHAINSNLALLRHLAYVKQGHPEELYLVMARLAGALSTFHLATSPRDLPLYTHDDLTSCFESLDKAIRRHLDVFLPVNVTSIPLRAVDKNFYSAVITDKRCLGRSQWVLGVDSTMDESALIAKAPELIKICSGQYISKLVERALPGLPLTHLATPPNALAVRPQTQYFGIRKSGPCWDFIMESGELGIYVPGELSKSELELSVILGT